MKLTGLMVDRVVVHGIPKREPKANAAKQVPLEPSQAVSPLATKLRDYFNLRLLQSLQSAEKAFDVVFDDTSTSPIPGLVRTYLGAASGGGSDAKKNAALVKLSTKIAQDLFDLQPPQPPAGLLAVSSGTIGSTPFLAVMKLEHESGVTAEQKKIGGKRTFQMSVEESLVLVAGTKVFKAAVFCPGPTVKGQPTWEARLSDSQNPFTATGVAAYFARDLLGVKLEAEPRVTTERVFRSIELFINEEIDDPARKVSAERSLLSEFSSNKGTFSAQVFGNQHLQAAERIALRDHLTAAALPTQAFPKDLELIAGQLKMMALHLDGRITVVGPQDSFADDTIVVEAGDGGPGKVTINADLKKTGSRAR